MSVRRFALDHVLRKFLPHPGKTIHVGTNKTNTKWYVKPEDDLLDLHDATYTQSITEPIPRQLVNQYDCVTCIEMLEHVPPTDYPTILHNLALLLKEGGTVVLSWPFSYWYHADPIDCARPTAQWIESLAQKHGLETVELRGCGSALAVAYDALRVHLKNWKLLHGAMGHGTRFFAKGENLDYTTGYVLVLKKSGTTKKE